MNNKCLNCGADVVFDTNTQMLTCKHCGSSFPLKNKISAKPENLRRIYSPSLSLYTNQQISKSYMCSNCGTKISVNPNESITRCASCGNVSLKEISSQTMHPDGIIPFEISRTQAEEIFKNWIKTRKFAPNDLIQMAKHGKLSGIYTPVYNFDYSENLTYRAMCMKITHDSDGNERRKHYPQHKEKVTEVNDHTISANSRIEEDFLAGLGSYDFSKLKPFSTSYLLGFAGIDTNIEVHTVFADMSTAAREKNQSKINKKLNSEYDRVENLNCTTTLNNVSLNYAYIPVWANHYKYNGKEYHCFINGQTGTATGKAPKSFGKILALVAGIIAGAAAGIALIISLISKM